MSSLSLLLPAAIVAAGCGWSPPGAPPPPAAACDRSTAPGPQTVDGAVAAVRTLDGVAWAETGRGQTRDCRLTWVQVGDGDGPAGRSRILFFAGDAPAGLATSDARPYVTVTATGEDSVTVQYQFSRPGDATNRPTGIGVVDFRLGPDGMVAASGPIPGD